jgi:hypothetical protein
MPSPSNWGLIEIGSASPTLEGGRRPTRTGRWSSLARRSGCSVRPRRWAAGWPTSRCGSWDCVLGYGSSADGTPVPVGGGMCFTFLAAQGHEVGGHASSVPLALDHPVEHYSAASLSPMVASSLRRALDAAQVTRLGVSPVSIVQFAANAEYALTGRVEAVADLLGRRSLDLARRLIDPDWQVAWAPQVRMHAERGCGLGPGST